MVKQITFKQIVIQLKQPFRQSLVKLQSRTQATISIKLEITLGNSFDKIYESIDMQQIKHEEQLEIEFQKHIKVFLDEKNTTGEIKIHFICQNAQISTISKQLDIIQSEGTIILGFSTSSTEEICEFRSLYTTNIKQGMPLILFKNIACQLKDNITNPGKYRYLQVIVGQRKYRNKPVNHVFYWETPFKIYIEEDRRILCSLVEAKTQQKIFIPVQKADDFTLMSGFRRVYIFDQTEMPKGCIQFYYQTEGLRSKEQYEMLAELEQNFQKQILKLTIKTIKIKTKIPYKNLKVRAFSNMNFILSEEVQVESSEFLFHVNKYLYLDPKENKCNLTIYQNNKILGNAVLMLNMTGFFQRSLKIIEQGTKKELGYIMVNIESQKIIANSIQLAKLKIDLGQFYTHNTIFFLSFHLDGYYTRTQFRKAEQQIIQFRRLILMKYKNEQKIQIALTDSHNHTYYKTTVDISLLVSNQAAPVCKKILTFNREAKSNIELFRIDGDLNKINIEQQIWKINKIQEQKNKKNNKGINNIDNVALIANHVKVHQRYNIYRQTDRKISASTTETKVVKNEGYKIMYVSKDLKEKAYARYKSSQKQIFSSGDYYSKNTHKKLQNVYKIQLPNLKLKKSIYNDSPTKFRYTKELFQK